MSAIHSVESSEHQSKHGFQQAAMVARQEYPNEVDLICKDDNLLGDQSKKKAGYVADKLNIVSNSCSFVLNRELAQFKSVTNERTHYHRNHKKTFVGDFCGFVIAQKSRRTTNCL